MKKTYKSILLCATALHMSFAVGAENVIHLASKESLRLLNYVSDEDMAKHGWMISYFGDLLVHNGDFCSLEVAKNTEMTLS